jgi:hypothetical protein
LNRVRVIDLPGVPMDEEVRGQRGFDLISVPAMARYARVHAAELALPEAFQHDSRATRAELPHFIAAALTGAGTAANVAAQAIVRQLGRNLGHLLLALHRGDQVNRDAREDWTAADWERWAHIERVWLAGGLTSGALGDGIVHYAREWLVEAGCGDAMDLRISPQRGLTSLVGSARYLPHVDGYCLAFDFGQTAIKRSLVGIKGEAIDELALLPPVRAPRERPAFPDPDPAETARRQKAFMTGTICVSLTVAQERGATLLPDIMVCLAAYVDGGRLVGLSDYNSLMALTDDVRVLLADAIAERTGRAYAIHLIHDGTAAAAVFAGQPNTAAIALGTALGVGFAPHSADGLLEIDAVPPLSNTLKGSFTDAH